MVRKTLKNLRGMVEKRVKQLREMAPRIEPLRPPVPAVRAPAPAPEPAPERAPKKRPPRKKKAPRGKRQQAQTTEPDLQGWDPSDFQVPEKPGRFRFHDLDLPDELMHAIHDLGFEYCTPIQAAALPMALEGRDIFGRAQTGTGKTAAFLIAILTRLHAEPDKTRKKGAPRALILAPTRELAMQIHSDAEGLSAHMGARSVAVYGGMDFEKQQRELTRGAVDVLVATPGRLLDFQRRRVVDLSGVDILVIDEADRMLDMGFIPDVSKIIRSTRPKERRNTMLYSATLTPQIKRLAERWTRDPVSIETEPEQIAVETVSQVVYIVTEREKLTVLYNLARRNLDRILVFCNRRDQTHRLSDHLKALEVNAAPISGDVRQEKRVKTLARFKEGDIQVLVATDVAARGIHVEGISHVVNYHLPENPEDYVHRIGRTGRAGEEGISVSFATEFEAYYLPDIEEFIGRKLPCEYPDEELLKPHPEVNFRPSERRRSGGGSNRGGGRPGGGGSYRGGGRPGGRPGGGGPRRTRR